MRLLVRIMVCCVLPSVIFGQEVNSQASFVHHLDDVPYKVGFRVNWELDETRPNSHAPPIEDEKVIYGSGRPVRVYLWYPAQVSGSDSPMLFERVVRLAATDFYPSTSNDRIPSDLPVSKGLPEERWLSLLKTSTRSHEEAKPQPGRFPVIVFGQGLYYENPATHFALCEYLASRGYVVATCPLTGTHSRWVKLNAVDLESQVRDLEVVLSKARRWENADAHRLALAGFDLGAMSCLVLAMRNPDIDAFVSLDGGILYGHPSELPQQSPHYDEGRFTIPWMHMTRTQAVNSIREQMNVSSLFERKRTGDSYLLLFDETRHVDFTSYALIPEKHPVPMYWGPARNNPVKRYETIALWAVRFFDAYVKGDGKSLAFLKKKIDERVSDVSFTVEIKNSEMTASPSVDDLVNIAFTEGLGGVRELLAEIDSGWGGSGFLDAQAMNLLGYRFLYSWGRVDVALEIFKHNVRVHPEFANTYDSLGEAYLVAGDREMALQHYRRSLVLNPNNTNAQSMIDRLQTE